MSKAQKSVIGNENVSFFSRAHIFVKSGL